jgi:hypothetical protein
MLYPPEEFVRKTRVLLIGLLIVIGVQPPLLAWNATGHLLTALIAYDDLDPATRQRCVEILRRHPRFEEDFLAHLREHQSPAALDRWIFAHAATWPDIARELPDAERDKYNRPQWHFVDVPVFLDDAARAREHPDLSPSADPAKAEDERSMNLLQALNYARAKLRQPDDAVPPAEKAVMLCWVMHLVGDIHQPLHCACLVSAGRFDRLPAGDMGGNAIPVSDSAGITAGAKIPNLHYFWDNIPGESRSPRVLEKEAKRMEAAMPRPHFAALLGRTDIVDWMNESHALAISDAYSQATMAPLEAAEAHPHVPLAPIALNAEYIADARKIAMNQITLAGYRLADVLRAP